MIRPYASSETLDADYSVYIDANNVVSWALGNLKPTDVKIIDQGLSRADALLLAKQKRVELKHAA